MILSTLFGRVLFLPDQIIRTCVPPDGTGKKGISMGVSKLEVTFLQTWTIQYQVRELLIFPNDPH